MISKFLTKTQLFLSYLFFISPLLSAIKLFEIGTFNFSLQFLVSFLLLLTSILLSISRKSIRQSRLLIFLAFVAVAFFISLSSHTPFNASALLLLIYWLIFYVFVVKNEGNKGKNRFNSVLACKIFISLSTILCLYGIFQFVSCSFISGAPFSEIIPESLTVSGYNTYQYITIGSRTLFKAHSIYLEASSLSQFSAITLIFCICLRKDTKKTSFIFVLFVNAIGLLISFSGTGLLMLAFFFAFIFLRGKISFKKVFIVALLTVCVSLFLNTSIGKYFSSRLGEMSSDGYNSGYYRFVLPFKMYADYFKQFPLGFGVGNDNIPLKMYGAFETSIGNGFGKIMVELGIAGLIVLIILLISIYPSSHFYKTVVDVPIFLIVVMLNIVGTSYIQASFWSFASALSLSGAAFSDGKAFKTAYDKVKKLETKLTI